MLKRKRSKALSLLLTAAMIFSNLTGLGGINIVRAAGTDKVFDLVEITDFHGALVSSDATPLPVAGVLAKNIKDLKANNPDRTLIMGGGDLYQGSPISNVLRGVPVQQALSNIGMEVTALGNHEFDWTLDILNNKTMLGANYGIVCANLYNKSDNTRVYQPYKVITKDNVKIAVIGAITTDTPSIVMPANVQNYTFTDPAIEINTIADKIKADNTADVIIALIHEGDNLDNKTGPIFNIANNLSTNVNVVFGGHSHSKVYAKSTQGTPIFIANSSGKGFIDVKLTFKADGTISIPDPSSSNYIAIDNTNANGYKAATPIQDPQVKAIVDNAAAEVGPTFSEKIGTIASDLNRTQMGSPYGESYLGNWASDVVKSKASADVGIANNGGLRTNFSKGDVTVGQVYYFMPFDNEINTVTMNKAELKLIMEQAFSTFQDPAYPNDPTKIIGGKGIQISGIKIKYDSSKPALSKIVDITRADGTAIGDNEVLTIAGPDFILTGGDGFTHFTDSAVRATLVNTHILVRDALISDVRANSTIKTTMDKRIENLSKTISIVATSDVHGNVLNYDYAAGKAPSTGQGLAKVSTYVNGLRTINPNNIMLVDNGDTIQGTPLSYYYDILDTTSEYPMMKVMGAMGYDSWTLGNHEYNYGLTTLNRIISDAKKEGIHVLSGNTYKGNSNFVEPYIIKNFNENGKDIKVGILGLTTKTIPSWEDAVHYTDLQFKDLVDEANKWVPIMKNAGANVIIVAAHTGEESSSDVIPENQAKALAAKVDGIDVVLAGHAHSIIPNLDGTYSTKENMQGFVNNEKTGKKVLITEPGKNAQDVSRIDINVDMNGNITGVTTKVVAMDNTIAEDPAIVSLIKPYQDITLQYVQTVLGTSTDEFTGAGQYVIPTALMDLINKVQMEAASSQLSIAAPLSASAYIPKGNVTIQNIMGVYVYENYLYGVKMTGKQLKDWMEYSVRYYKQINDPNLKIDSSTDYKTTLKDSVLNIADYNLDMLYGATYDIDLTQPACTVDATTGLVSSGNRIKNLKLNGKLVKDSDLFTVAINNYRFNGGGGFTKAAGLTIKDTNGKDVVNPSLVTYDSGKALGDDGQVRSLMMSYIKKHKTITPDCSNNWKLSTAAVRDQNIAINNDTTNVVNVIKSSPDKSITKVNIDSNTIASKDIFTAIAGKDQTVIFQKDGVTWTFNGLDIKPELIKDIDLSLKTVSADLKAKETAKAKAIVGKDVAIASFSFTYEGKLPGKADVKIFIGKDWANRTVNVLRYFADKNTYEVAQKDVAVDAEGYIIFTTDHCSDYFVLDNTAIASSKLPQTGSTIDFTMVVDFGALIAALGVAMVIYDRKKKRVNA